MSGAADHQALLEAAWADLAKVSPWHQRHGAPLGWLDRRRLRKARERLEACRLRAPDDPLVAWGLGRVHLWEGDLAGAAPLLAQAAAAGDAGAELHLDRAIVALALGEAAAAELHARAAVDLSPDDDDLKVIYTYALLLAGQARRALGVIANVCKRDPDHAAARAAIDHVRKVLDGRMPAPTRWPPSADEPR